MSLGGVTDILTQAMPIKEYPGRVRGVGFGVSQKAIFGALKRTRKDENEELKRMVAHLYREVQELKKMHQDKGSVEVDQHLSARDTTRDSCTLKSHKELVELMEPMEGIVECSLFLPLSSRPIGKGISYTDLSVMLHNHPLPPGHVKVGVGIAYEAEAQLPIPLEDVGINNVGEAVGTFVAWLQQLVRVPVQSKPKDKVKGKGKQQTVGSVISPAKN